MLAYAGALSTPGRLTWFDRGGNPSESVGSLGDYTDFRLSPDQTRLAASLADPKTGFPDIWITDLTRGSSAPFTFGPAVNASPVWAPDGARIIFRTSRTGGMDEFYAKSAGGGGKEEPVLLQTTARASGVLSGNVMLWDWSPDGRHLLFSATDVFRLRPVAGTARGGPEAGEFSVCAGRSNGTATFRRMASWWRTARTSLAALKCMFRPFP